MKNYSDGDAISAKKAAFRSLNSLIEHLINENDYKKATLISKWLKTYSDMISFESRFVPERNISYKRGDVVKANFGFRIGSELGGAHYSVVIDNHNNHSSDSVTVIPLGSDKGKCHPMDVSLGDELFKNVNLKYKAFSSQFQNNAQLQPLFELIVNKADKGEDIGDIITLEADTPIPEFIISLKHFLKAVEEDKEQLNRLQDELNQMKSGSIAKVGQITTISKIRIIDPTKTTDPLGGIRLSADSMKLIDSKIRDLFLWKTE